MTSFKLGMIECIHYHVPQIWSYVDHIVQIHECHDDLFWSGVARFGHKATVHEFISGENDHQFSIYFINKVGSSLAK